MRHRGLEPFKLLDLLGRHASSGGAHVLSGHDGPMRVLEPHVVEVRLLRTKGTLKLTDLLLEAHAAAALFDAIFVERLALLREGHELVRSATENSEPKWHDLSHRRDRCSRQKLVLKVGPTLPRNPTSS